MERFIGYEDTSISARDKNLKSSMERFIVYIT